MLYEVITIAQTVVRSTFRFVFADEAFVSFHLSFLTESSVLTNISNGATVFPTQLALAASWNPDNAERMAAITAKEVAAEGLHWTFSPVLCLGRDARWGRIDETFGEDPYLAGKLGAAAIRGYQGTDTGASDRIVACAKHYIV